MLTIVRRSTFVALLCICSYLLNAQGNFKYQTPPKDITDLVLAEPTPLVFVASKGEWMLIRKRMDFPTIEELAQPEVRIGGLRFNSNNFGQSRAMSASNIQLKNIKSNQGYFTPVLK